MENLSKEARITLALQALHNDPNLSIRKTITIYSTPATTIRDRRDGKPSRRDFTLNLKLLTDSEEIAIVKYILQLDSQGLPPWYTNVKDIANHLLSECDTRRVGVRWVKNFV